MGNRTVRICFRTLILAGCLIVLLPLTGLSGQDEDAWADFDREWNEFKQDSDSQWNNSQRISAAQWDDFQREQARQWREYKAAVERKWAEFQDSTKKIWVDYGPDLDAMSAVDFEHGAIEVCAIVAADSPQAIEIARERIQAQVRRMLSTSNAAGSPVLKGQVKDSSGEVVTNANLETYAKEVAAQVAPERESYQARDGQKRIRVVICIDLVLEHLRVRAVKYIEPVNI